MHRQTKYVSGMSLVEVMATIAILGILTALAIPAFRSLQGRQTLLSTQKGMQSVLYRMQQLALAPLSTPSSGYDVIGYALAVYKKPGGANPELTIGGCRVKAESDLVTLMQIVKFQSGSINNYLVDGTTPNSAIPNSPTCATPLIDPQKYPNTFYIFPAKVQIADTTSPALPWLIVQPLVATGRQYGDLCQSAGSCLTSNLNDPLTTAPGVGRLQFIFSTIKDPTSSQKRLCREVVFSRDVTVQADGKIVPGGCSAAS